MKVRMYPTLDSFKEAESGIKRVIEAYEKYLPEYGVELVGDEGKPDLVAIHAGTAMPYPLDVPLCAHLHGLYWTGDYRAAAWEWRANHNVVGSIRYANQVTVPSEWVAEALCRDMRFMPHILPHGIEPDEWEHDEECLGHILWNKNRVGDVCDPAPIGALAQTFQSDVFVTTYAPQNVASPNIHAVGLVEHEKMKEMIQTAGIYLSTTKETFGIGVLEALASGVPVLGYDFGGNKALVKHGVNGYLARPGDLDDLKNGLAYCKEYRHTLGENARASAAEWSWGKVVEKLVGIYELALVDDPPTVGIVIPSYNYADKVGGAIESALSQDYDQVTTVVVVDDGSEDGGETERVVNGLKANYSGKVPDIIYLRQSNQGVAHARNNGIDLCQTKYVLCLDADDRIDPRFVSTCVQPLENNPSLGIAYTGLYYTKPDGEHGISPWPGEFDYDQQLRRKNQIPTCSLYRKEMWKRLGGYKQRYAPLGAGAEDAEFYLRAGAYGWDARKVTSAGLFKYAWMSGRVSGDPDYKEVDWTAYHPWVMDGKHPFGSVATPKHISHPVRQYDEPTVSVIIPVSEDHIENIVDALDSLEAQTERKWEAIVVRDSDNPDSLPTLMKVLEPYPYVRLISDGESRGAGHARNRGVEIARAPLLLFLDADDNLFPKAIEYMLDGWQEHNAIIYSDYVGKATIDPNSAAEYQSAGRLLHYDTKSGEAVLSHKASDYDCDRAIVQPNPDMYIWNLITSLVPKIWHDGIGGFDENMESWEDWDYWIRMAKAGHCFVRISEPLVVYRFYSGTRRESGLQSAENLLEYLLDKYAKDEIMPCNCPGKRSASASKPSHLNLPQKARSVTNTQELQDEDLVRVRYASPKRGAHKVVGPSTRIVYGYRSGGDMMFVHQDDITLMPHLFQPIKQDIKVETPTVETPPPTPVEAPTPTPLTIPVQEVVPDETPPPHVEVQLRAPEPIASDTKLNLQTLPGITNTIALAMQAKGWDSMEAIAGLSVADLQSISGIGQKRAEAILAFVNDS